jgi:hypothetical protein
LAVPSALGILDFVMDPVNQKLIGNPAHDGKHIIELYCMDKNLIGWMRRLGPTAAISTMLMTVMILTNLFFAASRGCVRGSGNDHSLVVTDSTLRRKRIVSAPGTLVGNDPCPPETMRDLGVDACKQLPGATLSLWPKQYAFPG